MKKSVCAFSSMFLLQFLFTPLYSESAIADEQPSVTESDGFCDNGVCKSPCDPSCFEDCCESWLSCDRLYLGFEVGPNWALCGSEQGCKVHTKVGYAVGGILGYEVWNGFALEFEAAYRNNSVNHINNRGVKLFTGRHVWSMSYLFNLVYELPCWCWKPFLGAGIGYSSQHGRLTPFDLPTDKNFHKFAYQFLVGLDYNIWCDLDIGIGYKYLHALDSYVHNHALLFDLKWHF
ncbi:MAG: porin family protein [Verrucomicrobia bacterium]|nr:porin family protein [Verrucomicrobiota bacterium]